MPPPKKHHYTPNFVLRRFADRASRTLWVWDKEQHKCWPQRGGPKERYEAFAENHYNTIVDTNGQKDLSIESYCAKVEADAAPVIDELVHVAQAGLLPAIGLFHKESLCRFLWIQHIRSPFMRTEITTDEESRQIALDSIVQVVKRVGADPSLILAYVEEIDAMVEIAAKKVIMMDEYVGGAFDHMKGMSLDVGVVPASVDAHFVTSDRPCLISPLLRPGGMACMPVAHNVVVQLSRAAESRGDLHTHSAKKVHGHNIQTFETSVRFVAGPCKAYLEHLASSSL